MKNFNTESQETYIQSQTEIEKKTHIYTETVCVCMVCIEEERCPPEIKKERSIFE